MEKAWKDNNTLTKMKENEQHPLEAFWGPRLKNYINYDTKHYKGLLKTDKNIYQLQIGDTIFYAGGNYTIGDIIPKKSPDNDILKLENPHMGNIFIRRKNIVNQG